MGGLKQSAQCNTCHENPKLVKRNRKFEQCEDCRRESIKERLAARRVVRTVVENALIEYNTGEGWRVGYLLSYNSTKTAATIQPIGPLGKIPDTLAVCLSDIKSATGCSKSCPTVQDYYRMYSPKKVVVLVADRATAAVASALANTSIEVPRVQPSEVFTPREQKPKLNDDPPRDKKPKPPKKLTPAQFKERCDKDSAAIRGDAVPKVSTTVPETSTLVVAGLDLAEKADFTPKMSTTADGGSFLDKPVGRMKHAAVDLTKARELFENGMAINDIVEAVRGTRAAFDVKKLVRKTLKTLGLLKD